jgi:hypothetical protein
MYVEMHWSGGAQTWVPVQFTEWLPYGPQPHSWQMHPAPGMRYLQAWVADLALNVSAVAAKTLINYVPATDAVARARCASSASTSRPGSVCASH